MEASTHQIYNYLLRLPSDKQSAEKLEEFLEDEAVEKEPDWEEQILCRQCYQVITSPIERMEVQGSHQHTFANPAGILYQIGCFRLVRGCSYAGPATEEWSWFKGLKWRIAVCSNCFTHLGWIFLSAWNESFHGLILDRLVQGGKQG